MALWHTRFVAKRPRDPVQLVKQVFDIAIGEAEDTISESKRHPSAKRKGGLKGGKARASSMSAICMPQISFHTELAVGADSCPSPRIAPSLRLLL